MTRIHSLAWISILVLSGCGNLLTGNSGESSTFHPGVSVAELTSATAPSWQNIVAYWKLNEPSTATSVADSGPNGIYSGTLSNVTLGVNGLISLAAKFNGTNSLIKIGPLMSLSLTGMSEVAWVQPSSATSSGTPRIVGNNNGGGANYSLLLSSTAGGTTMRCLVATTSGSAIATSVTNINVPGQWYHLACVWDGTRIHIYVNGVDESSLPLGGTLSNTSNNFAIGADFGSTSTRVWKGLIDEVAIWNVGLSASDVATLYRLQTSGSP